MMVRSIRLIPLTMLMAFLLLGLKVGEVMHDGKLFLISFGEEAQAQQSPTPAETPAANTNTADAKTPAAPAAAKPAEAKATDAKTTDGKTADGKTADAKTPADANAKPGEPKANPPSTDASSDTEEEETAKHEFSQVEIDLLQSLAKRRQELDDWSKQVQLKENMLIAIENRIDEKTNNLEKMKKEVEDLLAKYNEQEDIKIKSLVKIYESMKPKDAARIFEELDMPVLLMVVDRMSERKVGAILADMNPTKAKDVTVQLAEQRKLQKNRPRTETSPLPASQADATGR